MKEKLSPKVVALSLAVVSGILYIVCAILLALTPAGTLALFNNLFHGIDLTSITKTSVTFGSTLIGLIEIVVYALITGWLFAKVYNYFSR
ncbi:hypothetical protein J4229_02455 [Candidatus Pacearchaeota archaeon]|nr:hypothetical protein [Candidatus Pacearchaeota archaeon]